MQVVLTIAARAGPHVLRAHVRAGPAPSRAGGHVHAHRRERGRRAGQRGRGQRRAAAAALLRARHDDAERRGASRPSRADPVGAGARTLRAQHRNAPPRRAEHAHLCRACHPHRRPRGRAPPARPALEPRERRAHPTERPCAADARAAPDAHRRDPRRRRRRRAVVRRPSLRLASRRRLDGERPRARLRLRCALSGAPSVDPSGLRVVCARGRAVERRGLPRPRGRDRRDRHVEPPRRSRAARAAGQRRRRSGPRPAALLQPQVEQARGLPLRAGLGRRQPRDLQATGHPRVPGRERRPRKPGEDPPGVGGRRARRPIAAAR